MEGSFHAQYGLECAEYLEMTMNYLVLLPMVTCFVVASILAYKDKDGWGWFLFVGLLVSPLRDYLS